MTHDAGGPGRAAGEQDQLRAAAERLLSRRHAEPLSDDFGEALDRARQFWADADMLARAYIALGPRLAALEAALRGAAEVIGDGFTRSGGTDQTSWDECRECGQADWQGHKPDCQVGELVKMIRLALAAGRGPGEGGG